MARRRSELDTLSGRSGDLQHGIPAISVERRAALDYRGLLRQHVRAVPAGHRCSTAARRLRSTQTIQKSASDSDRRQQDARRTTAPATRRSPQRSTGFRERRDGRRTARCPARCRARPPSRARQSRRSAPAATQLRRQAGTLAATNYDFTPCSSSGTLTINKAQRDHRRGRIQRRLRRQSSYGGGIRNRGGGRA